jgi:hypothetical protein
VGPRAGLDALVKRTIPARSSLVAISTELSRLLKRILRVRIYPNVISFLLNIFAIKEPDLGLGLRGSNLGLRYSSVA